MLPRVSRSIAWKCSSGFVFIERTIASVTAPTIWPRPWIVVAMAEDILAAEFVVVLTDYLDFDDTRMSGPLLS